jgi:hypothetical protein
VARRAASETLDVYRDAIRPAAKQVGTSDGQSADNRCTTKSCRY